MALRDIVIARKEVPVAGTSFSVRGLSFFDLSKLIVEHRADFLKAVEIIQGETATAESMGALATTLAETVPGLVASAIALAADEPGAADVVATLPAPDQLDALMAVGELTFTDPNAVPKFLANLTRLLSGGASIAKAVKG